MRPAPPGSVPRSSSPAASISSTASAGCAVVLGVLALAFVQLAGGRFEAGFEVTRFVVRVWLPWERKKEQG